MTKFIPYEKLSKKKKRELDLKQRTTWGSLNPVTRRPPNPKAYNRKKARKWKDDPASVPFAMPSEKVLPSEKGYALRKGRCPPKRALCS